MAPRRKPKHPWTEQPLSFVCPAGHHTESHRGPIALCPVAFCRRPVTAVGPGSRKVNRPPAMGAMHVGGCGR